MTAEQFLDSVWQITGAAPSAIDAPVIRSAVAAEEANAGESELTAQWIWGDSAANGQAPAAGETISLRTQLSLPDDVAQAGAVMTCDNGFTLFVNGREVKKGTEWTRPEGIPLRGLLRKGDNTVVIVASNGGNGPNAAGLFFEARVKLINGEQRTIASDDSWQFNANSPKTNEGRLGVIAGDWKPVTVVPALDVWTKVVQSTGPNLLMLAISDELQMVRASLLKNDFLMRSLGRPFREQIVSMRPTEFTTLEAIDLSNGATLASYLAKGANNLSDQWPDDNAALVEYLFQFALSRKPTNEEQTILGAALSTRPNPQEIEDVLWAIFMMPEFLLVR